MWSVATRQQCRASAHTASVWAEVVHKGGPGGRSELELYEGSRPTTARMLLEGAPDTALEAPTA